MWIVDRREQVFEDTSVFESGDPQRRRTTTSASSTGGLRGEDAKFAADWGLKLQLATCAAWSGARRAGRHVILGGHSAGASTAVAYAAWDFGGRPGYRDIDGLVLIDGGLLGSFAVADLARAKRELADIRRGKVFLDLLGSRHPRDQRHLRPGGGALGVRAPDEPSVLQRTRCCRTS